ncbi:hypothetical protein AX15_005193 [Amanita polypyramis BW_CC]|nr:hypothetical protein AX15_005193 [Amanita polypyramis BW_CC]
MPELSQYEIEREANIARNRALLEQLELKQAVEDLGLPKPKPKAKPTAKPVRPTKRKREKFEVEAPRRQSARLRGAVDPNESPEKKQKREAELEIQRAKEAEARLEAEERARVAKLPRHQDLELSVLLGEDGVEELDDLTAKLSTLTHSCHPRRLGDTEAYTFHDNKNDAAAVEELRKRLNPMKIVSRAKVTQDRVYSCAYHPEPTKDLIFFGDKHGLLGIWDARAPPEEAADEDEDISAAEDGEGGKYWRLQAHWPATAKSSISCIKFDPVNAHNIYTSSYDCTIRCLSFTTGISREIFSTDETLICSIDLDPSGHDMWISDGEGGVTHLDLRQHKSKAKRYFLSDSKIGCISVNPTRPNFLLTASNNRSLKIWDVRNLKHIVTRAVDDEPPTPSASSPGGPEGVSAHSSIEFDSYKVTKYTESKRGKGTLRAEWPHGKSVSSAYWDPRGRQIISTSYDDTLRLWDLDSRVFESSDPFPASKPFGRIRHSCQTGKWLTILRAQWSPNPDVYPHFTIGNMNHSLDIFSCRGELITRLSDSQRISAVQAVTASHPNIVERVVSGNASGRCVLWAPQSVGYS